VKVYIKELFRQLRLMLFYDKLIYLYMKIKNHNKNYTFKKNNPLVKLPPDYIMFESFGMNYSEFYLGGIDTAKSLINYFNKYQNLQGCNILEWGCGPARIIRHFPDLLNQNCKYFGTDYNSKTINWCKNNIKNINFGINTIDPPLNYTNNFFDIIFGISVFTHLSESKYYSWFDELLRITKPGGIILITTHGYETIMHLNSDEKEKFKKGNLITKSNTFEGHRTFASYAPEIFMKKLLTEKSKILYHKPGQIRNWGIEKDLWIVKK